MYRVTAMKTIKADMSHYDQYGNLLTSSQNNYSYGDGPIDSWSYARSDGRHHNKQASNNPNIYKNHNINNKHVNHSKEKYNQNVNFLGHQLNPTDWPTLMEEKLLRTLRELYQVRSNGWDPARR